MTDTNSTNIKGSIAQIIETLDTGGAEHLAIKFANTLAQRGYKSHLYVTSHDGPLAAAIDEKVDVRIFGYRRASISNPVKFGLSIREGFSRFRSALRADHIALCQTHLPGPNFWGLALQKRGVCQSVATIHNNQEFSYGSQHSLRGRLRHQAYRGIITNCAATIAVSDQVRVSLIEELGLNESQAKRFISIPNGVEIAASRDKTAQTAIRKSLGISDDRILCLAVGRVCEQKNFKALIPVAKILKNRAPKILLVVAGDGPDFADLRSRIDEANLADTIQTLGNVTNVPDILAIADLFVMPSLWEGLPLALLEAMGSALPVVGYAVDGLSDVVLPGKTGFLVDVDDHQEMAAKIMALASDEELSKRMGQAGKDLVRNQYSLARVVDSLESLYQKILNWKSI